MNFTINQTNGIRETVNSEFINKLHNLFITNRSSHTINLSGYLYSPTGYKTLMDALNSLYGPDLVIEVPVVGLYILIEDPNVLQILLDNNISSDGIGISATDAANATFTSNTFSGNTDITSFPEFNLFTKANGNSLPSGLFYGCTNLTSINLSEVTVLKENFARLSGIVEVLELPNLTSLGKYAFYSTGITSITDLGSITSIPDNCFCNCTSLTSVTLPSTCISLGNLAFRYCNSLTNINLSNVKTIGYRCFENSLINNIDLSSLINYGQESFHNCGNISLTLPSLSPNSGHENMFSGNTRLVNIYGSVENWTAIHRNFPKFSDTSSGIDVLYFKNVTSIYAPKLGVSSFGEENGFSTTSNSNVGTKAMYIPKLQEISCGISSSNRLLSVFGNGVQLHVTGDILKIDLLYFKNLTEIISSPFGGLVCQAFVINNTTPPTITPQIYNNLSEYYSNVNNVKVNAWGDIEDATDPTASITNTGNYYSNYNTNKKLRHIPTITAIYVPDSAVNTYKTTTGWTSVAGLIQPISSLNSGVVYATLQDWETAGKPVGLIAECLDLSTADLATFMSNNNLTYWTNPNA